MRIETFDNVWDALEGTPEEAANMTVRSELLIALDRRVKEWKLTQAAAAERLGITQPRLNDLFRGRINKFSLDALVSLAARARLKVEVKIRKAA